ncbi:MAG TPA: DMT family transporter [Caldimonas sp.]|jgi:drug/metabolite transporter (DMT)-like permease|nr:DMT family transporter [Caldimonas sp.]
MTDGDVAPAAAPRPSEDSAPPLAHATLVALSTYFVLVWGAGFVATRIALQYAAPFSYIGIRYSIALVVALLAFGHGARWPQSTRQWGHVAVAGLLSHAGYLGGSHYAQRLGLSAGVTALILALQPLLTALIVSRWLHERLAPTQRVGIAVGLAGVALVVGERALAGTASAASLGAIVVSLLCVTAGTLYQREFCAATDLRAAVCIHFAATAAVMLPLGVVVEGFDIHWNGVVAAALVYHVVLASIGAYSILHLLMRHGQATGVTSLLYLTPPVAALVEWAFFRVAPSATMWLGMAVACVGVAMTSVVGARFARGTLIEERS